jgi:hypothetical protein
MGLISYFKRNYQNAGVRLPVTAMIVADHRVIEHREAEFFAVGMATELHLGANNARVELARRLSSGSPVTRTGYSLPRDYWRLAHMAILDDTRGHAGFELRRRTRELSLLVFLLVDIAFNSFQDGDCVFIDIGPKGVSIRVINQHTFACREHEFKDDEGD